MAKAADSLTPKQVKALACLLSERTVEEAAKKCGVASRTLRDWTASCPAFSKAWATARRQLLTSAVSDLAAAAVRAVKTLVEALDAEKDADKIKAATAILGNLHTGLEQLDVAERVEALEALLKAKEGTP